ncbi:glycoside hydrolase family 43 protein [Hyaloscypha bicolor E]|uniref:Glycoside hydrolase family 43 protein n=1 Tax=Hyaloscypha bicolor E TaxID=1095630 RepID=A0A2J6TLD9_9HELO|nr:glycoside hydrolase family 43 protein [Hyaloscypha bicolor E]PMD63853.1 glycoside hydrolase family 43 protein [Hyaloscypha bicolor E]
MFLSSVTIEGLLALRLYFVPDWDDTYFCASSSFLVFPGIPIHASRDLIDYKLVSNALRRPEQEPGLNTAKRATSGIWASTIRYREGIFYVVTSLVYDDYPKNARNRFDSFVITSTVCSASWSNPFHFIDDDGQLYIVGTHVWEAQPGIQMVTLDLKTGAIGPYINIWNGSGASAPEGPHIYNKDGYYYLLIAEGGTGSGHMVTTGRSKNINGPYESNLFQHSDDNWWAVALSVRQVPDGSYPMGRETWPVFTKVSANMNSWHLEPEDPLEDGEGSLVVSSAHLDFPPGSNLSLEFVHWRFTANGSYIVSPPGHSNSLQLASSLSNLTGADGRSAELKGQTFIARPLQEAEVGVTVFLDQLHHWDLGIVMSSNSTSTVTASYKRPSSNITNLVPYLRLRGITAVPSFIFHDLAIVLWPAAWKNRITLEIRISNITHYTFSAGPASSQS